MIVSLDSGSTKVRKVGSSLVKRFSAFAIWSELFLSLALNASEMTGSATYMEVIA
jgi:hypothetical protein